MQVRAKRIAVAWASAATPSGEPGDEPHASQLSDREVILLTFQTMQAMRKKQKTVDKKLDAMDGRFDRRLGNVESLLGVDYEGQARSLLGSEYPEEEGTACTARSLLDVARFVQPNNMQSGDALAADRAAQLAEELLRVGALKELHNLVCTSVNELWGPFVDNTHKEWICRIAGFFWKPQKHAVSPEVLKLLEVGDLSRGINPDTPTFKLVTNLNLMISCESRVEWSAMVQRLGLPAALFNLDRKQYEEAIESLKKAGGKG